MYIESIHELVRALEKIGPRLAEDEALWHEVETHYLRQISERYEADLAFAYLHSTKRKLYRDVGEQKAIPDRHQTHGQNDAGDRVGRRRYGHERRGFGYDDHGIRIYQ